MMADKPTSPEPPPVIVPRRARASTARAGGRLPVAAIGLASAGALLTLCVMVALLFTWRRGGDAAPDKASGTTPLAQTATPQRGNDSKSQATPARPLSPAEVFAKASPAVVVISTKDEFGDAVGQGSGFLIDPKVIPTAVHEHWDRVAQYVERDGESSKLGYLLTNEHVIHAAASASASLSDGGPVRLGQVLAENETKDLAVLVCWLPRNFKPTQPLVLSSTSPVVGACVFAIGSPQGLANTLSEGLVSAHRKLASGVEALQTSAAISPGSSGGPLVDDQGHAVGVVTASKTDGQNLNFAIASGTIRGFLATMPADASQWRRLDEGRSITSEVNLAYESAHLRARRAENQKSDGFDPLLLAAIRLEHAHAADNDKAKTQAVNELCTLAPGHYEWIREFTFGVAAMKEASSKDVGERILFNDGIYFGGARKAAVTDLERAMTSFQKCVDLKPEFKAGRFYLALTQMACKRDAEALANATELTAALPFCGRAWLLRGAAFSNLGRADAAIKDQLRANELLPSSELVSAELGQSYRVAKDYSSAILWLNRAIERAHNSALGHKLNLAYVYGELGNLEKADELIDQARRDGWPEASANQIKSEIRAKRRAK